MLRLSLRLTCVFALVLLCALPGCVVFRTAGKAVGTGLGVVGEVIQAVVP